MFVLFSEQATYTINPGSRYASVLAGLSAGDVVTFKAGTHTGETGKVGFTLNGTPSQPITIQGNIKNCNIKNIDHLILIILNNIILSA